MSQTHTNQNKLYNNQRQIYADYEAVSLHTNTPPPTTTITATNKMKYSKRNEEKKTRRNNVLKKRDKIPKTVDEMRSERNDAKQNAARSTTDNKSKNSTTIYTRQIHMENAQSLCIDRKLQWLTFPHLFLDRIRRIFVVLWEPAVECVLFTIFFYFSSSVHNFEIYAIG